MNLLSNTEAVLKKSVAYKKSVQLLSQKNFIIDLW